LNKDLPEGNSAPPQQRRRKPLPPGYREGVITAITMILGFSLFFLRYWSFEAEGSWSRSAVAALSLIFVSIALQILSLWRSLQVADDDETEYAKTLRFFLSAIFLLLLSLIVAGLNFSNLLFH
jgi:hypothetical protein